jgi:lysozyme
MNLSKLRTELTLDEGLRLKPYTDTVGKLTIGVGRNLEDVGISPEEAQMLLDSDIERATANLNAAIPWWSTLDEVRQRVLVNMCFNLGIQGLLRFKNTLALVRAGKYEEASVAMLQSIWAGQVGSRAARLAHKMKTGEDV